MKVKTVAQNLQNCSLKDIIKLLHISEAMKIVVKINIVCEICTK